MKHILVTGSAGFIGANLVMRLLKDMNEGTIVGLDSLNDYYDVSLKEYRLKEIDTLYETVFNGNNLTLFCAKKQKRKWKTKPKKGREGISLRSLS